MSSSSNFNGSDNKDNASGISVFDKALLTRQEASAYSNIGLTRLSKLLRKPGCPFAFRNGNRLLVKKREFDEFIRNNSELNL